jgi:GDPmannose 4,6-dehydratase
MRVIDLQSGQQVLDLVDQRRPDDYIIATGVSHSLVDLLETTFSRVGLDYRDDLISTDFLIRPLDIQHTLCDTSHTESILKWRAERDLNDIITEMLYAELQRSSTHEKACKLLGIKKQKSPLNVISINTRT